MTALSEQLDRLVRMIQITGADHLELAGWRRGASPLPGQDVGPDALRLAEFCTIGFGGERLATETDADIALYLLIGAMARTGVTGAIVYVPGMALASDMGGRFPTALPDEWQDWAHLWSDLQGWIVLVSSAHGQIELHRRADHRAAHNTGYRRPQ